MSDRNRKLKNQSAHRNKAAGAGYFASTHNGSKGKRTVMSDKKIHSSEVAEAKNKKNEPRVGKKQGYMLGNRTKTDRGREGYGKTINRLNYIFDWVDPAAGSKYIGEFSNPSHKPHYTMLVRMFLNDNFEFYNDVWRHHILKYLISKNRLHAGIPLIDFRIRLTQIKNNFPAMSQAMLIFGPAFLPRGFVIDKKDKRFIHNIPIKNGSLKNAQKAFFVNHPDIEAHIRFMTQPLDIPKSQPLVKSALNGNNGEFTNTDDVWEEIFMSLLIDRILANYGVAFSYSREIVYITFALLITCVVYYFTCDWTTYVRIHGYLVGVLFSIPYLFLSFLFRFTVLLFTPFLVGFWLLVTFLFLYLIVLVVWFPSTAVLSGAGTAVGIMTVDQIFAVLRGGGKTSGRGKRENSGSKGRSFISNKIKNKGSGGKSKQKKDPVPFSDSDGSDEDQESLVSVDGMYWDRKRIIDEFHYSKTPNIQTTHFVTPGQEPEGDRFVNFDCYGAPFCGLVCIDVALGILPKPDVYCQMARHMGNVYDLGEARSVAAYAHYRGVNLSIISPMLDAQGQEFLHRSNHCNNPQWRWVILKLSDIMGGVYIPGQVGHYTLQCNDRADSTDLNIPLHDTSNFMAMFVVLFTKVARIDPAFAMRFGFNLRAILNVFSDHNNERFDNIANIIANAADPTVAQLIHAYFTFTLMFAQHNGLLYNWRYLGASYNRNNNDVRSAEERAEPFSVQDHYGHFHEAFTYYLFGFPLFDLFRKERVVSVVRVVKALKESQFLGTSDYGRLFFGLFRGNICNTNDSLAFIYRDTQDYLTYLLFKQGGSLTANYQNKVIAYNDLGAAAYVGNLPVVQQNQMLRGGANHVKKLNKLDATTRVDAKKRQPVAFAPIGALETEKGTIGPGLFCRTEYYSLLAAFCGRSMQRVGPDETEVEKYLKFSLEFLTGFLKRVDLTGIIEEDNLLYFQHLYRGKKTASWIESKVKDYRDFQNGVKRKKFTQHSCFVKKEDSRKRVGKTMRLKPRLIMTMSDKSLIETCQVMKIIHAWCSSPFAKFQVKNLLPDEFVSKIQNFTCTPHIVTDYSSFEASVAGAIRKIEHFFVRTLCKRAGLDKTLLSYEKNFMRARTLHCKAGKFKINSRCSGDFMTSAGNGLQNVCLSAYSHYKNFGDLKTFQIIAEGDDGLIREKTVNMETLTKLDFSFSSSLTGNSPGEVDFLRCRWVRGCCLVNVGRAMKNVFWVKPKTQVGSATLLQLLKCMAMSLNAVSPGHPILYEVVNRIGRATIDVVLSNKTLIHHFNWYKMKDFKLEVGCPTNQVCNEHLRGLVATGAKGFPPISIPVQLELERRLRDDSKPIYIGDLLDDYDDISDMKLTQVWASNNDLETSEEIRSLLKILDP